TSAGLGSGRSCLERFQNGTHSLVTARQQTTFRKSNQFAFVRSGLFAGSANSLGEDDGLQLFDCLVQDLVHENIAVFFVIHNLLLRILKSSLYYFGVNLISLAAIPKASL